MIAYEVIERTSPASIEEFGEYARFETPHPQ